MTPFPKLTISVGKSLKINSNTVATMYIKFDPGENVFQFIVTPDLEEHWFIPRKLQHTPRTHPGPSPGNANYERNPGLQPVGKGLGVCSKGMLKQS